MTSKTNEDIERIQNFMNSNSLIVNEKKSGLLIFRSGKSGGENIQMQVGEVCIEESEKQKLLGITLSSNFNWTDHISNLVVATNSRLFTLKKLTHHIPANRLYHVANSLVISKIRYALPVYGRVRLTEAEPKASSHRPLEVVLNNTMRTLMGYKLKDKIPLTHLHRETGFKSLNQMTGSAMLQEMWKIQTGRAQALEDLVQPVNHIINTRAREGGDLKLIGKSKIARTAFPYQSSKLWNECDIVIRQSTSLQGVRQQIKKWADTLPL